MPCWIEPGRFDNFEIRPRGKITFLRQPSLDLLLRVA